MEAIAALSKFSYMSLILLRVLLGALLIALPLSIIIVNMTVRAIGIDKEKLKAFIESSKALSIIFHWVKLIRVDKDLFYWSTLLLLIISGVIVLLYGHLFDTMVKGFLFNIGN